jgi:hypothetical protein
MHNLVRRLRVIRNRLDQRSRRCPPKSSDPGLETSRCSQVSNLRRNPKAGKKPSGAPNRPGEAADIEREANGAVVKAVNEAAVEARAAENAPVNAMEREEAPRAKISQGMARIKNTMLKRKRAKPMHPRLRRENY